MTKRSSGSSPSCTDSTRAAGALQVSARPGASRTLAAHLASIEVYNEACLEGKLRVLHFSGNPDDWNEQGVAERRRMKYEEVLAEWERRQRRIRDKWGRIGLDSTIQTSAGPYPLRLQVWHHAMEYATHADDIEVPVPANEREARLGWRTAQRASASLWTRSRRVWA